MKMLPPSGREIAAKIREKDKCTEEGAVIKISNYQTRRILADQALSAESDESDPSRNFRRNRPFSRCFRSVSSVQSRVDARPCI